MIEIALQHIPEPDDLPLRIRDLDAHGSFPRHRGENTNAPHLECKGEIVGKVDDALHFDACCRLELIQRDYRPGMNFRHAPADIEIPQRLLEPFAVLDQVRILGTRRSTALAADEKFRCRKHEFPFLDLRLLRLLFVLDLPAQPLQRADGGALSRPAPRNDWRPQILKLDVFFSFILVVIVILVVFVVLVFIFRQFFIIAQHELLVPSVFHRGSLSFLAQAGGATSTPGDPNNGMAKAKPVEFEHAQEQTSRVPQPLKRKHAAFRGKCGGQCRNVAQYGHELTRADTNCESERQQKNGEADQDRSRLVHKADQNRGYGSADDTASLKTEKNGGDRGASHGHEH